MIVANYVAAGILFCTGLLTVLTRRNLIKIVLGLSLGQSAVYSLLTIIQRFAAPTPLKDQSAQLNASQSSTPWLDLTYQLLDIAFSLAPVLLAAYFLWRSSRPHLGSMGIVRLRPLPDIGGGLLLALVFAVQLG